MLPLTRLSLEYTAIEDLRLPDFLGSAWRGALGHVLRRRLCLVGAEHCTDCAAHVRCEYAQIFENRPPPDAPMLSGYPDAPRPYLVVAESGGRMAAGESRRVDLQLIGTASRHKAALRPALPDAAHRIHPRLQPGQPEILQPAMGVVPPAPRRARIVFLSPVRLRVRGVYLSPERFAFENFFSALLRRLSQLHAIYGDGAPVVDARALVACAARIKLGDVALDPQRLRRYSNRQRRSIPMDGVIGGFTIEGDIAPLWPWLWEGQWLHVGKGADMGLGRYRVRTL